MKTIIFVSLCLCLVVSNISAEKAAQKHAEMKKMMKAGHEQHGLKEVGTTLEDLHKSPLPLIEEVSQQKSAPAGREGGRNKHHRHGKNKKRNHHSEHHQMHQQHQGSRARKHQRKTEGNGGNGSTKPQYKHGRKNGRGKQTQ